MTVSVRGILVAALVAMALVVSFLLGGSGGAPAQATADDGDGPPEQPRVLTMTGVGHAIAVPDQLSFGLSVKVTRDDLDTALGDANATMKRVLGSLEKYGVSGSDVQTTGLSMSPVYDYHQYSPPTIRGYRVSEQARVLVTELKQGGSAVSAAVAAGGNDVRVGGIRLLVGETDAVMEQARDAAVAEARTKAEQYAAASGQQLGDVVTLREVRTEPLPTPQALNRRAAYVGDLASAGKVPIRAGQERGTVTVRVVWELE